MNIPILFRPKLVETLWGYSADQFRAELIASITVDIVAFVLGAAAVAWFPMPVETIGSKFGGVPQALPALRMPRLSRETIRQLFQPATTIALLAAIESLLCALEPAGRVPGTPTDSVRNVRAAGAANQQ